MSETHQHHSRKLENLRAKMEEKGLQGYILLRTDEFQGEFLAEYAERVAWLTGFTGSAGSFAILGGKAVVMSDGRYSVQLKNQVDDDLFDMQDSTEVSVGAWLAEHASEGDKIGYDVWLYTPKQIEKIQEDTAEKSIELIPLEENLVDLLWQDQPEKPVAPVILFPDEVAGRSSAQKRHDIALKIQEHGCAGCLITAGDSICWLLNVRGSDIDFSPLVLSYAFLHADGSLDWFVDEGKISQAVKDALGEGVNIFTMASMEDRLSNVSGSVWLDRASAACWFEQFFIQNDVSVLDEQDPCVAPKAIKSSTEQDVIREAHIHDGVALVKFLKWFEEQDQDTQSELSVEEKLEAFRAENPLYFGPSFSTITGFGANGAIVHYRATQETNKEIKGDGLLLIDSGGQYQWGTTDITRTIAVGTPTDEMKENYTRVLKGHIAVAAAEFPEGTLGKEVDALARKPLQDAGLDYAHGTGHGVGCYLCVHEAAANMSIRGERAFEAGMLLSNEPGYYKEGEYGIRLENLVLVVDGKSQGTLAFETVTFVPFDHRLVVLSMLDDRERAWLTAYHKRVENLLAGHLEAAEMDWLRAFIGPVKD